MDHKQFTQPDVWVWDFNGTLLDDVDAGIAAVNTLLRERELPTIPSREAYQAVFGFPIREYYVRLGFDFDREPYEVVAPLWVEEYLQRVKRAGLFSDAREIIEKLHERGVRQIVLSATERGMLLEQISDLGLSDCFEEVLGLDNIHAASKLFLAEEWRARNLNARVLFVGDTDHDVETARVMGAECALVARGHQSAARLKTMGVPVFSDLRALYERVFE